MIVSEQYKFIVFMPPKNGTASLHEIFKHMHISYNIHGHMTYSEYFSTYPEKKENYRCFAFYRDPIKRLMSSLMFIKRTLHYNFLPLISPTFRTQEHQKYSNLDDNIKNLLETYTVNRMLDMWEVLYGPKTFEWMLKPQINWLDYEKMELLDLRKYDEELDKLVSLMGGDTHVKVSKNESIKLPGDEITPRLISFAKEFYEEDYRFFASKGISFD